jgi:hypothetical protein
MEVEFNTKTEKIKSGILVKYNNKGLMPCYYGIYLTDIDGENPILYDLEEDQYYKDVNSYDIEPVIGDVKLVVE